MMKTTGLAIAATLFASSAHAALTISAGATQNVTCAAGVCVATAKKAVLNVTDLTNLLAAGSLTVQSGNTAKDIRVEAPFSWTSSNSLTLDSYLSIEIDKSISDAGSGDVAIVTSDGGTNGEFVFGSKGSISFLSTANHLTINEQRYKLANSLPALAAAVDANPSGNFALANSYDASADGTYAISPIAAHLLGHVNGLGNTISRLTISHVGRGQIGLFSHVDVFASISSLNLAHADISSTALIVGGLVGDNVGTLFNDSVTGSVLAPSRNSSAGGLAGFTEDESVVELSHTNVKVLGGRISGGLVGAAEGHFILCYATGNVSGKHGALGVGGLIGRSFALIMDSYASGKVTGSRKAYVGGLVGLNQSAAVVTSYSTGQVSGEGNVGGLLGANDASTVKQSYWDITTSGTSLAVGEGSSDGITGLTDAQLKSGLPAGFDPEIWAQSPSINNGYPYLIANSPP